MAMVIPRSRSSGALSIDSKARYSASPFRLRYLVIAAVRLVLPWSMWPIVPMFTCGLFRSNFFFDIWLLPSHSRDDLSRQTLRHLVVRVQLHRRVRRPSLGPGPQLRGVAEQLGQRHDDPDGLL